MHALNKFTNQHNIDLIMAAYLATDNYDYQPNTISATSLLKPVRQHVLSSRVPKQLQSTDLGRVVKSRIGTSIHDSVEQTWTSDAWKTALKDLGVDEASIASIQVNPGYEKDSSGNWKWLGLPVDLTGIDPVYVEIRTSKEIEGVTITGKFDSVTNGQVGDIKTTSVYTWINQTKVKDYVLQGSIYRWLNPELINKNYVSIHYVFTDWSEMQSKANSKYPQSQVLTEQYELLSLQETEEFIRSKLQAYKHYASSDDTELPQCNAAELWQRAPVYKYYKDPNKRARATKNFDSLAEANLLLAKNKGVGIVVPHPGQVVACKYCPAFEICRQKDQYLQNGTLKL